VSRQTCLCARLAHGAGVSAERPVEKLATDTPP
jgi:hypothetical protein